MTIEDLTGKQFNHITVLGLSQVKPVLWECRCDCGHTLYVNTYRVKHEKIRSCGKCNLNNRGGNTARLVGKKYNSLSVVSFSHFDSKHKDYWNCLCDCGNTTIVQGYNLTSGRVKSCGCGHKLSQVKDITGYKTGKITVVGFAGNDTNGLTQYTCQCECGNTFIANRSNILAGHYYSCGCSRRTQSENEVYDFIASFYSGKIERNKRILDGRLEIDILLPDLNLGIEYNGSAYHASIGGIYKDLPKEYHQHKFLQAQKQGIHLINLFDVDWGDRVKDYLADLIKKPKVIYGRQSVIRPITKEEANAFCDCYHLQGGTNANNICYGLFKDNELYSVMTFGNSRYKKKSDTYELYRYCVRSGYTVLGGAQKLLKAFEREYCPEHLISYSDNDYFSGNIYSRLGFHFVKQCAISYYWFFNRKEIKREKCQAKKLAKLYPELYAEATGNKENYIMSALGAKKVYRAGNTRWEKDYE